MGAVVGAIAGAVAGAVRGMIIPCPLCLSSMLSLAHACLPIGMCCCLQVYGSNFKGTILSIGTHVTEKEPRRWPQDTSARVAELQVP